MLAEKLYIKEKWLNYLRNLKYDKKGDLCDVFSFVSSQVENISIDDIIVKMDKNLTPKVEF